jgi:Transposase DDE domain
MSLLDLFCSVDTFWQQFEPLWEREQLHEGRQRRRRRRATRLSPSELMTILILFQSSGYRTFKDFYTRHVQTSLQVEFPGLVSYTRFVALMPRVLLPLAVYLHTQLGECTDISFIDATSLAVCHPARIRQHRVFVVDADVARRQWGGSMASNSISSSTTAEKCLPSASAPATWMTGVLSPAWSVASLGSCSGTRAISPSRSPKRSWSSTAYA